MPFSELLEKLMQGDQQSIEWTMKGISAFHDLLRRQKEIRIYVDGTPNFGHQASTIHLLRRLIDVYEYSGGVKIVYQKSEKGTSTPDKLALLLTGLDPSQITSARIEYGTCKNITFLSFENRHALPAVTLGFTGGADTMQTNYAKELNVDFFLRLQPYLWKTTMGTDSFVPNRVEFGSGEQVELSKLSNIFPYLAYKYDRKSVQAVPPEVWDWYIREKFNPNLAKHTENAYALFQAIDNNRVRIWPAYGLHQFRPEDVLLNILLSGLYYQSVRFFKDDPIVLTLINDLKAENFTFIDLFVGGSFDVIKKILLEDYSDLLLGGSATKKQESEIDTIIKTLEGWHAKWEPARRVVVIKPDQVSVERIQKTIGEAQVGQVLIIPIGSVPQPVYNYFYARAGMPGLFEGEGTSSLVISTGVPYLRMPKPAAEGRGYPTTLAVDENFDSVAVFANDVAATIRRDFNYYINNKPTNVTYQRDIERICLFLSDAFPVSGQSLVQQYFNKLGEFYQQDIHDKLLLGLAWLGQIIQGGEVTALTSKAAAPASESRLDLQKVYDGLIDNWKDGGVDLVSIFPESYMGRFYKAVTGPAFFIQVAREDITAQQDQGKIVRVQIDNASTGAFGTAFRAGMSFTAKFDSVVSDLQCRADANWSLEGVPWIGFENPGFEMRVSEGLVPVQGSVLGRVKGVGLEVKLSYPVQDNQWVVTGTFDKPYPDVSSIYQAAGGVNLVQSLPPPLNTLAGFGLNQMQIIFDANKGSITYILFVIKTDAPWTILSSPKLEVTPRVSAVIFNPADVKARRFRFLIGGEFQIGDGTITINGRYPDFQVTGYLSEGEIKLQDIAQMFGADVSFSGSVTSFSFSMEPETGNYSIETSVTSDPPIVIAVFAITGFGFNVIGSQGQYVVTLSGSTIILPDEPGVSMGLRLAATYKTADKSWLFEGRQTSGPIPLGKLMKKYLGWDTDTDYDIDGIGLTISTKDDSYVFTGKTAKPWPIPFLPKEATLIASLTAGYNGAQGAALAMHAIAGSTVAIAGAESKASGPFGRLEVRVLWLKQIDITIWFDYNPKVKSFGFTWSGLENTVKQDLNQNNDWTGTLKLKKGTTLGSMVEMMVSWVTGSKFGLEEPWSILNDIGLSNLSLVYNFTKKTVSFGVDISAINLGFARIDGIEVNYQSGEGVMVSLNGSFPWNVGEGSKGSTNKLAWDASKPGDAPAPSGNGRKYLDLRLLAMGQHVTLDCFKTANTVQDAIKCMQDMPPAKVGTLPPFPPLIFDPQSSWLIGADFGVLRLGDGSTGSADTALEPRDSAPPAAPKYFLTLQVIFNDPRLYALRIALDGEPAKIFKGLDFQIMYRQVSDTVGVYQAEITLPDVMRRLSVGAYTIVLPVFGIAIYTNGDFQVDIGFPWNQNFTRSFTIEGIIYPGIPVIGSAGIYFGKLSSSTTNKVPEATNGTFNPVIVFGFGMQVGFGKSVQYGVLSAGFSLTAVGILEGVIGKWNPYQLTDGGGGDRSQIQGAYYFWLRGTFGIMGKLYGTVDFAIIKADVNVAISLLVQLTYESYVSLAISVIASVSVSVSIRINLGWFKIKISFSFSLRLMETFKIDNSGVKPWHVKAPQSRGLLREPADHRLQASREVLARASVMEVLPNWSNLLKPDAPAPLSGYLAPALAMARDEWEGQIQDTQNQLPCYIALMFLDSVPAANEDSHTSALKAAGAKEDTSFETFAKMVLRWVIAYIQDKQMTAAMVDDLVISETELSFILEEILVSSDANPSPIPADKINQFMSDQFRLAVTLPPDSAGEADATFFPIPPALLLDIPAYGSGYPGCKYTFAEYNSLRKDTIKNLREYFNELAVQVESESRNASPAMAAESEDQTLSMASWILTDYFLLTARQMVQAAREGLRNFKFDLTYPTQTGACPLPSNPTAGQIVDWITCTGSLSGSDAYSLYDLFVANATHELDPLAARPVTIGGGSYEVVASDSFEKIALDAYQGIITDLDLAVANAPREDILQADREIVYKGQVPYVTRQVDSLVKIAEHFGVPVPSLLINSDILLRENLLVEQAVLSIPLYAMYQALSTDTFQSIAEFPAYGKAFQAQQLAELNAGKSILNSGQTITYPDKQPYVTLAGDSLDSVAKHFEVSLAELLPGSGVLMQPNLLIPVAQLQVPPFSYGVKSGDTLGGITAKLGIQIDVLAYQEANGQIKNLFESTKSPLLDVPHLAQFQVRELIAEAQRSLALQQLSGMASRYYLHGLRLPTDGITPNKMGMWVRNENNILKLPSRAGLYALTGQQFPLPLLGEGQTSFQVIFDNSGGPDWLTFKNETVQSHQLVVNIAASSTDAIRVQKVTEYARSTRLDTGLTRLGSGEIYGSKFASFPFTPSLVWQSASPVGLPCGAKPAGVPSLRLWKLPGAMIKLPDPTTRKVNPRFKIMQGRYDEASGDTIKTAIDYYGWASTIEFTVKKIPPIPYNPASATTYEIVGAGGNDVMLMERLLEQVGRNDSFLCELILGYLPNQTGPAVEGVQTDPMSAVTMGIAQVNLSTETRPPAAAADLLEQASPGLGLLNDKTAFIRLLWEASITRAGGFYLYYYNGDAKGGLPDRIFNDKGEASLTLIVLYAKLGPDTDDRLTDFMNAVATGVTIDSSNTVVFAVADPTRPPMQIEPPVDYSLASIAYGYYTDVGELAEANSVLTLAIGKKITVNDGVYEVPPAGVSPGGQLSKIASYFGTTTQAIKDANPHRKDWPDPLLLYAAIRLPQIEVTVGTSSGGTSLSSIAMYYRENLTTLAAHNQFVPTIFAAGQKVVIPGGPTVRTATVPPGVQALTAARTVPFEVPTDPNAPNFAELFLKHSFSLLNYMVVDNVDFKRSKMGLPAGPTTDPADGSTNDKISLPKILTSNDEWEYEQAMPYPKFAKLLPLGKADLPDPKQSPYIGVGCLLQVGFDWQDLYGNTLVTVLSDPHSGDAEPLNQPPMLTGYNDPLISLSQWPSISAGWEVLTSTVPGGKPNLRISLSFDRSRYEGLISASAPSQTKVVACFTVGLDPGSASDKGNYSISQDVSIVSATLDADGKNVELIVNGLSEGEGYLLTADNVKSLDGKTSFSGQARFAYQNSAAAHSSTVQGYAQQDLLVYRQLWHQLTDPNGIAFTIEASLLKNPVRLAASQVDELVGSWLGSIYKFIADRAGGYASAATPDAAHRITTDIESAGLNESQIFELTLSFTIERTGGAVVGDFETTPGIKRATTIVAPLTEKLATGDSTLGLTRFALDFELALSQPATFLMKVATGINRAKSSNVRNGQAVWSVRLGITEAEPISYSISDPDNPDVFAPRPISNQLESRSHVPIYDYQTGKGISSAPNRYLDFTGIDMDVWGRQFLEAIDGILSPEFTAATQIVSERMRPIKQDPKLDYLEQILAQKKSLAEIIKLWMMPVFRDHAKADPVNARDAFYQQLLVRLANAYTTRAALQFKASVNAGIDDPASEQPPRLFGSIKQIRTGASGNEEQKSDITLSSPKLVLKTDTCVPLAFLVTTPNTIKAGGGEVVPNISLNLSYEGSSIEHQIAAVPGIQGYVASSWLSFVIADDDGPLTSDPCKATVPLVLRAFPTSPSMTAQSGEASKPDSEELSQLTEWSYSFTYSLPFHYPQDRVYCEVDFNIAQIPSALFEMEDAFSQLAQFITVFPNVNKDLDGILTRINATTDNAETITNAAIALESFIKMVKVVTGGSANGLVMAKRPRPFTSTGVLPYWFEIQEGSATIDGVEALIVTVHGQLPAGIGAPQVLIDGYQIQEYSGVCDGDYCYWYQSDDGKPLNAADGQTIADRRVILPAMDILQRQDAWSSVYLKRNEELVPGKPIADDFIYTTPKVQFANPLHPTIESTKTVEIASVASPGHQPIDRTLEQHLTALFQALLESNTQQYVTFQVVCSYEFMINPAISPVSVPVMMQPPLVVDVKSEGGQDISLTEMIANWVSAIQLWLDTYRPNASAGALWFNLTVMSNLTKPPMPLLQLGKLRLEIKYITA